jgi:predicted SnoaL-like aldol condensation-catalyzing enzyme
MKSERVVTRDDIRKTLNVIFDQVFNQGQADLLAGLVSGPYIQHNPLFPNGLDGIMSYIKQAGRIRCEVKRIAIDGDLAFVHVRYLDWGGQETASVDIFRSVTMARSLSTGMCCSRCPQPLTTPTLCFDKRESIMKSQMTTTPFTGVRIAVSTDVAFEDVLDRLRKAMGHTSLTELVALAHEPITQAEFATQVQQRFVGESDFMLFAEFMAAGSQSSIFTGALSVGSWETR